MKKSERSEDSDFFGNLNPFDGESDGEGMFAWVTGPFEDGADWINPFDGESDGE
jgi:hypothetical protein